MWNYSFIFPSILILSVFIIYCFYIPRISIGINRIFFGLVLTEGLVMIFDIVSSMADEHYYLYTIRQLYIINDMYFVSFYIRAFLFYAMTVYILNIQRQINNTFKCIMAIPCVAAIILTVTSSMTGLVYYMSDDGYHKGQIYDFVIYLCLAFYIIASFIIIFLFKKNLLGAKDLWGAIGYNITLFTGMVIRKMFPTYLLMDIFCLIALIIIYLSFTNPDFFFDSKINAFNANALRRYVNEIKSYKDNRYIVFGIYNYRELREVYGSDEMDKGLGLIGQFLRSKFKKMISFYNREGRFVLIGNGDININEIIEKINKRFKEPWLSNETEMYYEVSFVQTADDIKIQSPERCLNAALTVLDDKINAVPGEVYYVRDADILQSEREVYIRKTLKWVIENDKTEVYLQPIVRADTYKIVGAEALARIKDPDGNRIMPGEFITIAEHNGSINQMGEQILKKTCRYIKDNSLEEMGVKWINVNLSPMQFMNKSLANRYNYIVDECGIDVGVIHLEITEEAMVDQMVLMRQIQIMKEGGFQFVLDDYGKGYSNLDRVKSIPFINIKIDMAIVRDYCNNPDTLLPSLIQTFKKMGFTVTAEGIETKEMADEMYKIGCDYFQGYLFSPPVPLEEFKEVCAKSG